jgi:hypothetical protein
MITFPSILAANGLPFVMQTLTHPAVYLDTWALRLLAEGNRPLGIRFREAAGLQPGEPDSTRVQALQCSLSANATVCSASRVLLHQAHTWIA